MTRQEISKAVEANTVKALRGEKIGFQSCKVIGSIVHIECAAASSANKAAEILSVFCGKVRIWDSINDDDKTIVRKVFKVAGFI